MRLFSRALAALALLCAGLTGQQLAQAAPALYVYTGPAYQGEALVPRFENMLGRALDGVTDFDDFSSPTDALGAMNFGLGAHCGKGHGLSVRFPAAFSNTTLQQVTAGVADAQYKAMFTAMQACVAPAKYVSIGHEMNVGTNYPWAGRGGPAFIAAYQHIFGIGRANCPSCKLTFNPGMGQNPIPYYPGDAYVDELDWDYYPTAWASGKVYTEPTFTTDNLKGYWMLYAAGPASGQGWKPSLPVGFPEIGVGSEGNGMGVCPATNPSGCDDGPLTTTVLAYMVKTGATRISWWDYDGGGYSAMLSDGLRPAEVIALCQVECVNSVASLLVGATAYAGTAYKTAPPSGYCAILAQLANGDVEQLAWGDKVGQTLQATDLTAQAAVTKVAEPIAAPPKVTGAGQGDVITVKPNADGSGTIHLAFPTTAAAVNYVTYLSPTRVLSFSDGKGGPSGSPWNGGKAMGADGWVAKSGSADIHYGPS